MKAIKVVLSADEAAALGVLTQHERMENGELRFRLVSVDGSGYIRTAADPSGGWQNSHYHHSLLETYMVESGWLALVELVGGQLVWNLLHPGHVYTTRPLIAHNIYLPGNAVIHTVKHRVTSGADDWYAAPDLDAMSKSLSEEAVLRRASPA